MYSKDYRNYLELLRARDVRPSFTRVAEMIAASPTQNQKPIPTVTKLFVALAITVVIGAGLWMLMPNTLTIEKSQRQNQANMHVLNSTAPLLSQPRASRVTLHVQGSGTITLPVSRSQSGAIGVSDYHSAQAANSGQSISPCTARDIVVQPHSIASVVQSVSAIEIPDFEKESGDNFFVTAGGAIGQQFSSNAVFRQLSLTDAFAGVGYNLSRSSSVRLLGGEEVFAIASTTHSISYTDTVLQNYYNVIGSIQAAPSSSLTRVYWLGASYRYILDVAGIRPFGEIMAGGSTDGLLSHQSLGVEFTATSHIDLDLLLGASELLPQNSAWLTKAGFAAEMSYRW
ncbi:MAG TPA: hypothetical protein VG537_10750 [Candidatus Kapabacteria bacterium]|jgi:hypothetical protein|nr:hypothetical protein [Candidatus Kapabacteria bacterium]